MSAGYRNAATVALVLLSCLALSPQTKALTINYNNICLLTQNNEMIATGDSCTDYYLCQNGVATLQTCSSNLYFSKDAQSCVPAANANCAGIGGEPCAGQVIGAFVPVPGSCSGYYYCGSSGAVRGSCPMGENFNATTSACQYSSLFPCGSTDINNSGPDNAGSGESSETSDINICAFMQNGVFFGGAANCSNWYLCTNNLLSMGSCPTDHPDFNPNSQLCDNPQNVNCAQVTHDPNLIQWQSIGGSCSASGAMIPGPQCNSYYVCNGASFQLNFCQQGYYFNVSSSTVTNPCVPRMDAVNDCDRCQGTTSSFVNMYGSNCTGYLYCQNGVEQSSGYCTSGFFNEIAGACISSAFPNFGCCNFNTTTSDSSETTTTDGTTTTTDGTTTVAAT